MRVHPAYLSRSTRLRSWRPPRWLREHAYIVVPGALLALLVIAIIGLGIMSGESAADNSAVIRACTAELDAAARTTAVPSGAGRVAMTTGRIAEVRDISPNGEGVLHITGTFTHGSDRWDFSCDARVSSGSAGVLALDMAPLTSGPLPTGGSS